MKIKHLIFFLITNLFLSCNSKLTKTEIESNIKIVGAMRNVMWKGELGSSINLDTIVNKKGLYGLGPLNYLQGELLINNGKSYVSKVKSDSTMSVAQSFDVSAPFFVYGNVTEWNEIEIPLEIKTIQDVEQFIDNKTIEFKRPFAFKIIGQVSNAIIHIQNLPKGIKVSTPEEAHQGQMNYTIKNKNAEVIGFFSTEHKGVFTHHDSFIHMHLITKDETKMGHLDELVIGEMKLYLPKE